MKNAHSDYSASKEEENSPKRKGHLTRNSRSVIECHQEIPCNVCELACHKGGIKVGAPLTKIPIFETENCSGCGLCVVACPGLAVFLVNPNYSKTEALVTFPYEYLPEPRIDSIVDVVNRQGDVVGKGRVLEVRKTKKFDSTLLVTVAVPKNLVHEVRGIVRQ